MMSLILGKKHTQLLIFNIKSDFGLDFFLLLSQSWACPRLVKTLALMHCKGLPILRIGIGSDPVIFCGLGIGQMRPDQNPILCF